MDALGANSSVVIQGKGFNKKTSLETIAVVGSGKQEQSTLKYLVKKYGINTKWLELSDVVDKR